MSSPLSVKSGGVKKPAPSPSPPRAVMPPGDLAAVALFDGLVPRLEDIRAGLEDIRAGLEQTKLRARLGEQREMVSWTNMGSESTTTSLHVRKPVYERADGEVVEAPMQCRVSKGGRSGPLTAVHNASVTFSVLHLKPGKLAGL